MPNTVNLSSLYKILDVSGDDAHSFLQGQITQNLDDLSNTQALPGAYCDPKGRVLASFFIWKTQSSYQLLVRSDVIEKICARLRMFVLRAKVNLSILDTSICGAWDGEKSALAFGTLEEQGGTYHIHTYDHDQKQRFYIIGKDLTDEVSSDTHLIGHWSADDIVSGLAWINSENQGEFIPQNINFDIIRGVSFNKGCYTGQEVVARSHFKTTIKKRAIACLIKGKQPELSNKDIFDANKGEPCGTIINTVYYNNNVYVLFEGRYDEVQNYDLRLNQADGDKLELYPIAYGYEKPSI